jgi:hypothetical protein
MISSPDEWNAMLRDGVVFDWIFARTIIGGQRVTVRAFAASQSQGRVLIWDCDKHVAKPNFKFAGHEAFELIIGEDVWNCLEPSSCHPEWDADSFWPEGMP